MCSDLCTSQHNQTHLWQILKRAPYIHHHIIALYDFRIVSPQTLGVVEVWRRARGAAVCLTTTMAAGVELQQRYLICESISLKEGQRKARKTFSMQKMFSLVSGPTEDCIYQVAPLMLALSCCPPMLQSKFLHFLQTVSNDAFPNDSV